MEKHIEGALVTDGYSREAVFSKRHQIRGFWFYPEGTALSESTYVDHLKQIQQNGTRQSVPYRRILRALQSYDLFL
jgi:photosystem II P680 reaction center D1 protein